MAISVEVMLAFQSFAEEDLALAQAAYDPIKERHILLWACFFQCAFCHSLRGWEAMKATLTDLREQIVTPQQAAAAGTVSHFGLPLLGRFKSCGNAQVQLLCMIAGTTASGLQPLHWIQRLLAYYDKFPPITDWLFQTTIGARMSMTDFNEIFYDYLLRAQAMEQPRIIPKDLDVMDVYFLARSFRRGATTRAQVAKVPTSDIEWVNRWGNGKELIVKGPMRVIYSERSQMSETFLRFSRAL
jgi:hypothetical protein